MKLHRPTAGVTLLELLTAMALLSLLSVAILFALRVGLSAMEKSNSKFLANRRVLGVERAFEQQVAGFMPVKVDCRTAPDAPANRVPLFQGDPQTMRFVSSYSLQESNRGYPRFLEYQVIPGENGEGVRLIVNEWLYANPLSAAPACVGMMPDPATGNLMPVFRPVPIGAHSFVLADKLAYCRFLYKEEGPPPIGERWLPKWMKSRAPVAIRLELAPLQPDPSRLQLYSLTQSIRVNRDPMLEYTDNVYK